MSTDQQVHCEIELWVRSKSGLRVRARGYIEIVELMQLPMATRGEVVSGIFLKAAEEIREKVTEMDEKYEEAKAGGAPMRWTEEG